MPSWRALVSAVLLNGLVMATPASTGEVNLDNINPYASEKNQITSISQFSDVRSGDWAYQALSNLVEHYGCVSGYPNGTFKGGQSMTRYEAAALLNSCLDRVSEVTDDLKQLTHEFEKELAVIRGRTDGLEAKVGGLKATQFSTTTKLNGMAAFVIGANAFGGSSNHLVHDARAQEGGTSFNYDLELSLDSSFNGKDLLRTVLRAGNFGASAFGNGGLNELEVAFQQDCGPNATCINVMAIDKLFYQFPINSQWTATVGSRVGQEDMLAVWPSVYPEDTILDVFTYNGAPAAYNKNLGPGAGLWWKNHDLSLSVNYVAAAGDVGSPGQGGIGNRQSQGAGTLQVAYAKDNWALAGVYSRLQQNTDVPGTTPFAASDWTSTGAGHLNAFAFSGYWQPSDSRTVPSVSAGWGYNAYTYDHGVPSGSLKASQSWYIGFQWDKAFDEANALGFAFGQPVFATSLNGNSIPHDGNYVFELWYKIQATDQISVTPAIFYLSRPEGQDTPNGKSFDNLGGVIKTTFKF
jgi:hypothetical protein